MMLLRTLTLLLVLGLGYASRPAHALPVQVVTSPQGITAWLVEDHSNPLIAVNLAFRGGSASDPTGQNGLTELAATMLDEGAGDMDSQAFQDRLDALNISLGFSAGRDSFSGSLTTLSQNRDAAFAMLHLALTQPRFDAAPLERMQAALQGRLRQNQESAGSIAGDRLFAALFPHHPYGRPAAGDVKAIARLTADDLRQFTRRNLTRDRLVIGVTGDMDAATLRQILDRTFGDLPAQAPAAVVDDVPPMLDGKFHLQNMPVPQAVAIFAQNGPRISDPDWMPFQVMMYILGDGGFASRLTTEVREKRGLAYGVTAESVPLRHAPLVIGSVGTQAPRISESLNIIRDEWRKMRDVGPTTDEISRAKSYLAGSMPLRLNSSPAIARTLVSWQYHGLPPDEMTRRIATLQAITPDDVRRIARKWLTPDALTFAIVGDTSKMTLPASEIAP